MPPHDLSIRYTERLAEAGAVTAVGSRGDSYDHALAESVIALYKAELVRRRGPWRGLDHLELATLDSSNPESSVVRDPRASVTSLSGLRSAP